MPPSPLHWLRRNAWRFSPISLLEKRENRRFDLRHGTDTLTDVRLQGLDIASPNRQRGNRYHPTPPRALRQLLARLRIDATQFSFVDIGSGKGRVLLVASDLPFKRVVGVEFAEELHRIAQDNIARYVGGGGSHDGADARVVSVKADATAYAFPDGALLLYLFKPFHAGVLREVLANVCQAAATRAEPVLVAYLYLEDERAVFDEFGCFEPLFSWRRFDVFACQPAAQRAR